MLFNRRKKKETIATIKPIELLKQMQMPKPVKKPRVTQVFKEDIKSYHGNNMDVTYRVFHSDTMEIPKSNKIDGSVEANHTACFSGIPYAIKEKKDLNRLLYIFDATRNAMKVTSYEDRLKWIDIAIANNALPKYIKNSDIIENRYLFKLDDKNLTPSLLYIYLTTIRVMNEEPGFVRNMITLIEKYKMDYSLAWVFASKISHTNSGHNIIPISRNGAIVPSNVDDVKGVQLRYAMALKGYLSNPRKYDTRSIYKPRTGGETWYNIYNIIQAGIKEYHLKPIVEYEYSKHNDCNVPASFLLSDLVVRLMNSTDSVEINAIMKEIKERNKLEPTKSK